MIFGVELNRFQESGDVDVQAMEGIAFDEQYHAHEKSIQNPAKRKRKELNEDEQKLKIDLGSSETSGPWAVSTGTEIEDSDEDEKVEGQDTLSKEQKEYLEEIRVQREHAKQKQQEQGKDEGEAIVGERLEERTSTTFHGGSELDYLGRSWIEPPPELQVFFGILDAS